MNGALTTHPMASAVPRCAVQCIRVVDVRHMWTSGQDRRHQRQHLVANVGSPRSTAQLNLVVNRFTHPRVVRQIERQDQSSISHQTVTVEGNEDAVEALRW